MDSYKKKKSEVQIELFNTVAFGNQYHPQLLAAICLIWATVHSLYCMQYYQHSLTVILMHAIANTTNECNETVCFIYYRD